MQATTFEPGTHLRGVLPEELAERVPDLGIHLARQVMKRLVREDGVDLRGIPGLSNELRAVIETGSFDRLALVDRRGSSVDPFVKYLFRAGDGASFECVRIPLKKPRWSTCVSTQAGCALACAFCETGRLGLTRSLAAWEMVEQVLAIRRDAPERPVTGVVFQGQGEPFMNYDAVIRAAEILRHSCGLQIAGERITISTSGLIPEIQRYARERHPYRLMLSLHSAIQERREELLPIAKAHPLEGLAAAMQEQAGRPGRRTLNLAWTLIAGWNDDPGEAKALRNLFGDSRIRLSLIDVNDVSGRFRRCDDRERSRFLDALAAHDIGFVRRYSGGPDVHAACGMLSSTSVGGRILGTAGDQAS
jgi:23S rRNA (adenine2503-C2)-methyltransferase